MLKTGEGEPKSEARPVQESGLYATRAEHFRQQLKALNEPGVLVISDAEITDMIRLGFLSISFDGTEKNDTTGASGIIAELNVADHHIRMHGRFVEERTDAVVFEYEREEAAQKLGTWVFDGHPEPTSRVFADNRTYNITPVTRKLLRSLNGYVYRNNKSLISYAAHPPESIS